MKVNDIITKTRLYIGDTSKVMVSDWEIINGINDALRIFAEEAARLYDGGGTFASTATVTIGPNDSALLPENYIRIKRAYGNTGKELLRVITDTPGEGEFSIRGDSIISGEPSVTLHYFGHPGKVDQSEDVIDLPDSMLMAVAKIAAACVVGSDSAMVQVAQYFSGKPMVDATANGSK